MKTVKEALAVISAYSPHGPVIFAHEGSVIVPQKLFTEMDSAICILQAEVLRLAKLAGELI